MKAGLRTKLLLPTIGIVILSMALASYFSARKASDQLWAELLNSARQLTSSLNLSLAMFTDDIKGAVRLGSGNETLPGVLRENTPETMAKAVETLKALAGFDAAIQGANLLDKAGNVLASSDPGTTGNFSDREYFKLAMKGEVNVSEPVISRVTNKPVFMVAAPVKVGGAVAGVLYVRVDLGKFTQDMIVPAKVGREGYAFLADKNGLVFAHPDPSLILKLNIADTSWGKQLLAAKSGTLDYVLDGKRKTATFTTEKGTGWLVAMTIDESDIDVAAGAVRNSSLIFSGCGILLVCVVIYVILSQMLTALGACVAYAESVAAGDLQRELNVARKDELGSLAHSLRSMVGSLRQMIETSDNKTQEAQRQTELAQKAMEEAHQAKALAETAKAEGMLQAAGRIQAVVEVATSASEELSAQIEQSSRGAESQAHRMGETAASMEEMNATVLEVARNASNASQTTDQARAKAQQGEKVVGEVIRAMSTVENQAQNLKENMDTLGQQAEGIGRILTVISDIADQTNLLALNAAIEAARAGDAGRGFAVVADEVRKLAEKTMNATKEVGDAIQGIQQGTRMNVGNMEEVARTVVDATKLATQSGQSLQEIVDLVENASDQVRSIATAAEEQSAASEEINRSIEEVNTISTETSNAMNQAAQAVSEVARQVQVLQALIEEMEQEAHGGGPRALGV